MTSKWLQTILTDYELEWCIKALEEANLNGKRTKKYVNGILFNWNRNGGMKLSKDKGVGNDAKSRRNDSGLGEYEGIGISLEDM